MKLSKLAFIIGASLCLHTQATARLGESQAECIRRYGEPYRENLAKRRLTFRSKVLHIYCSFRDSKCVSLLYTKRELDDQNLPVEMNDIEIDALLNANGGGKTWKKAEEVDNNKNFYTEDRMACYDIAKRSLYIVTQEELRQYAREKEEKGKEKAKGS